MKFNKLNITQTGEVYQVEITYTDKDGYNVTKVQEFSSMIPLIDILKKVQPEIKLHEL